MKKGCRKRCTGEGGMVRHRLKKLGKGIHFTAGPKIGKLAVLRFPQSTEEQERINCHCRAFSKKLRALHFCFDFNFVCIAIVRADIVSIAVVRANIVQH